MPGNVDAGNYWYSVVIHSMMATNLIAPHHDMNDVALGDVVEAVLAVGFKNVILEEEEKKNMPIAAFEEMAKLFVEAVTLVVRIQSWTEGKGMWFYSAVFAHLLKTYQDEVLERTTDRSMTWPWSA